MWNTLQKTREFGQTQEKGRAKVENVGDGEEKQSARGIRRIYLFIVLVF